LPRLEPLGVVELHPADSPAVDEHGGDDGLERVVVLEDELRLDVEVDAAERAAASAQGEQLVLLERPARDRELLLLAPRANRIVEAILRAAQEAGLPERALAERVADDAIRDELKLSLNAAVVLRERYLLPDEGREVRESAAEMMERVARHVAAPEDAFEQNSSGRGSWRRRGRGPERDSPC
jgi:hypothetical protein